MKGRPFFVLAVLALISSFSLGIAAPTEAFLDQPLPPELNRPPPDISIRAPVTYQEQIEKLLTVLGKPIFFPEGFTGFIAKRDKERDWAKGKVLFLNEGSWMEWPPRSTMRSYVDRLMNQLGLIWKFDPTRDGIATDFRWRHQDLRGGVELLQILASSKPFSLPITNIKDPWTQAFNALLSKPENFAKVWPLRFSADQRSFSGTELLINLVSGKIKDDSGAEHYIVVNDQAEICNPGPEGSISYYIFNLQGRFESGGIVTIGYRCFQDSAWSETNGLNLDIRTYFNGREKHDIFLAIIRGHLVRTDFLLEGAKPTNWQLSGLDTGTSLLSED